MTVAITINVPDALGQQLEQVRERLPEVLERGLHDLLTEQVAPTAFSDESTVLALLANQSSPETILGLRPSSALQSRLSMLLQRSAQGELTAAEAPELERILLLEHLVRLAKANALKAQRQP